MSVQYITNENGDQVAVVVPIEDWKKLKSEHDKLVNTLQVMSGLQDALQEVRQIREGKRSKGKTLGEFLNEV
jgi:hypothetical protein